MFYIVQFVEVSVCNQIDAKQVGMAQRQHFKVVEHKATRAQSMGYKPLFLPYVVSRLPWVQLSQHLPAFTLFRMRVFTKWAPGPLLSHLIDPLNFSC